MASMTQRRFAKLQEVLRSRQPDMTVLTDQVHKAQNVSAILRTADAVGIGEVHMVRPERGRFVYHHTSGGSARYLQVQVHTSVEDAVRRLRDQGFSLYAAHWSDRAINYRDADFTRPFALVMGSEKLGLSDYAARQADCHLTIPIMGMVASYNVSVAAAIILQEAMQRRLEAGFYRRPVVEDQAYRDTLFRWAQPDMADYCDRHGLPYPELDEDGDLVPPADPRYRCPI